MSNLTRGYCGAALAAACLMMLACSGGSTSASSSTTSSSELSQAYASTTDSTGTLLCEPAQAQIDDCSGLTAGADCTLTSKDGKTTRDGICRETIDGKTLACSPKPPAPPQALVDACTGKAAGDSCEATEAFGDLHEGVCVLARDGTTLICGRQHKPPQAAIDACANLSSGATCTLAERCDAGTLTGVCSLGPGSTGELACVPSQEIEPAGEEACNGLAAGAACTMGRKGRDTESGTCVTPASGGAAVCVVSCEHLGGPFECGPRGHDGDGDEHRRDGAPDGGEHGGGGCGGHDADGGSVAPPAPADGGGIE